MPSITCEHCGTSASISNQKFCEECGVEFATESSSFNSGRSSRLNNNNNESKDPIREEVDSDPEVQALKEKLAKAEEEAQKRAEEKRREEDAILKLKEEKERIGQERKLTESEIMRLKNELSILEKRLAILIEEENNFDATSSTRIKVGCRWCCDSCDASVSKTDQYCIACNNSFATTFMYCTSCGTGRHTRLNALPGVGDCNYCGHKFSWEAPRTSDGKCPKCMKFPSKSST